MIYSYTCVWRTCCQNLHAASHLNTISGHLTSAQLSPCLSLAPFLVNLSQSSVHPPYFQYALLTLTPTWRWMVKAWSPLSLLTTSPNTTYGSSSPSSQSPPILKFARKLGKSKKKSVTESPARGRLPHSRRMEVKKSRDRRFPPRSSQVIMDWEQLDINAWELSLLVFFLQLFLVGLHTDPNQICTLRKSLMSRSDTGEVTDILSSESMTFQLKLVAKDDTRTVFVKESLWFSFFCYCYPKKVFFFLKCLIQLDTGILYSGRHNKKFGDLFKTAIKRAH